MTPSPASPVRMCDPWSFKLPLTAKSVTVLLFCCFCSSYAIPNVCGRRRRNQRGGFLDQDPARAVRSGWRGFSDSRIDLRVALHVLEPTRSPLLPLIDLIFCLGSTWANLELAFPASVIDCSMISIRFSPSNTRLAPTSSFSFSFRSRMDQMNPIQITSCDRPTPTR